MIEGLKIRCDIGPVRVVRTPWLCLDYKRREVISRAQIQLPDPQGEIRSALAEGQEVTLRFGLRGENSPWHVWEGTIASIGQPATDSGWKDSVLVKAAGLEKKLVTTMISESFYDEPAREVARRLLSRTGLPVGKVDIPGEVLPHQIFSEVPVCRAIKSLEGSISAAFGIDLAKHAVWLGESGLCWSDGDEPGDAPRVETAHNLINHIPPEVDGDMGVIKSLLLPGLIHSRKVSLRDKRRDKILTVRAEEVRHLVKEDGNRTIIRYGKDSGWG